MSVLCTRFGAAFLLLAAECWGVLSPYGYRGQVFSVVTIHNVNVGQDVKSDNATLNLCSLTWPGINELMLLLHCLNRTKELLNFLKGAVCN